MRKYFFVLFIITIPLIASSQVWKRNRAELVFGGGATNFLGDLGGANHIGTHGFRDFNVAAIRFVTNIGYLYKIGKNFHIQTDLYYARLGGNDNYTKEIFRNNRNLSFRSPVGEFIGKVMYSIGREKRGHIYNLRGVRGMNNIQVYTYFFAGFGIFYFNPKAKYIDGKWHALQPLSTEGQGLYATRKKYHRVQPAIPIGMGFRYLLSPQWLIGIEYTLQYAPTDYIDDCSTTYANPKLVRDAKGEVAAYFSNPPNNHPELVVATRPNQERGDPRNKDAFMFMVLSLRYRIPYVQHFLGIPKF
ncbi:MAG: hypothetical protein WC223_11760 [Bacteroidales bacterium]|jgi:hypothetical protein